MNDVREALARFESAVVPLIEKAFQTLLEEKHLYQSVDLAVADMSDFIEQLAQKRRKMEAQVMPSLGGGGRTSRPQSKEEIIREFTHQAEGCLRRLPYLMMQEKTNPLGKPDTNRVANIVVSVQTVRTFCSHQGCGGLWPHNPCHDPSVLIPASLSGTDLHQVFLLRYQCQNCKKDPVTFLVKREGLKLSLTGRSPIEEIEVPRFVPKECRKFYRGAVLAFNCGAHLPAIFMLRTTIEQQMRSAVDARDKKMTGDELTDAYAKTIHADFNARYQSLKPVYCALSDAIHSAKDDDPELFKTQLKKVLAHFEAKEVFARLAAPE
ncbi:MAG: hypothetical protein WCI03_04120 [bacterium]